MPQEFNFPGRRFKRSPTAMEFQTLATRVAS